MWLSATIRVRGPDQLAVGVEVQPAVVGDRDELEDDPLALAQEMHGTMLA